MKRMLVIAATLYLTAGVTLFCIIKSTPQDKMRNAEANDIICTVRDHWPDVNRAVSTLQAYETDFLVIDAGGRVLYASMPGLETDYIYDFIHKDYSVDILENGQIRGRIIFINHEESDLTKHVGQWAMVFLAVFLVRDLWIAHSIRKHVSDPVKRMNHFAEQIAKGDLDIPVGQVDSGYYGAFTESFDIMREELWYAK